MTSKSQYEYFEARYAEELERVRDLQKKSQVYLSIISIISSIIFVKIYNYNDLNLQDCISKILICLFIADLLFILVYLIKSIRVQEYCAVFNPNNYLDEVPGDQPSYNDDDFYDNRVADFIYAISENQKINSKKAHSLKIAEYGLFALVIIVLVLFILNLV